MIWMFASGSNQFCVLLHQLSNTIETYFIREITEFNAHEKPTLNRILSILRSYLKLPPPAYED